MLEVPRGSAAAEAGVEPATLLRDGRIRPGDMVVCLGAGTISAWANNLPGRLQGKAA